MSLKNNILKMLKVLATGGAGMVFGAGIMNSISKKTIEQERKLRERYQQYYSVASRCLMLKNDGKKIADYFEEKQIRTVAIYGVGTMGNILYNELADSNVKVSCFIDANAEELSYGLDEVEVLIPDEVCTKENIDAIIVTPVADYDEIRSKLENCSSAQIISFETIVNSI